jgi:phospholipase C
VDTAMCGTKPASGGYADRCGYGPRLPLLVISPYSRTNYVDHTVTNQASITKFIEDNWHTGRIGDHSYDSTSGSLAGMFNFWQRPNTTPVLIDPKTGAVETH